MAIQAKAGSFTAFGSSSDSITVTGVGFTAQVIVFLAVKGTANPVTGMELGFGAAYVAAQRSVGCAVAHNDGSGRPACRCITTSAAIALTTSAGNDGKLSLASINSDGFVLDVSTQFAQDTTISYLALAGLDDFEVGSFTMNSGTGTQAVTGVGFQPDSLILFTAFANLDSSSTTAPFSIGLATATTEIASYARGHQNAGAGAYSYADGASVLTSFGANPAGNTLNKKAILTSFDADGFTIDFTTNAGQTGICCYLALKGGQVKVGDSVTLASTGSIAVTGLGFTPVGLLLLGATNAENSGTSGNTTSQTNLGVAYGASAEHGVFAYDAGSSPSVTTQGNDAAVYTENGAALVDLTSLDADGFTLNQSVASAQANFFAYFAIGNPAPDPVVTAISGSGAGVSSSPSRRSVF